MGIDFSLPPKHGTYRVNKVKGKRKRDEETKEEEILETEVKRTKIEAADGALAVKGFNGVKDVNNAEDFVMTSLSIPLTPRHAKVLLLDIEGCTTAISFVKDVLFPYVLTNLDTYVDALAEDEVNAVLTSLKADVDKIVLEEIKKECSDVKDDNAKEAVKSIVKTMVKNDVKATGLKSLQGKMWKSGYASGDFKGHVYSDFKILLQWCKDNSVQVNIYSSGSIAAQKLLFSHSADGDLTPFLNDYFDTTSGMKKESQSYTNIAEKLGVKIDDIVFVSDAEGELVAARDAGLKYSVMCIREGNAKLTDVGQAFPRIYSLMQLCGV